METNPAWVDAPYRCDFVFAVPRCPRKNWSRKRRLKWIRREKKRIINSFRPKIQDFDINQWVGEKEIAAMTPKTIVAMIPDNSRRIIPVLYRRSAPTLIAKPW